MILATFPELMDTKKCDIMKWTKQNPITEGIFMLIKKGTMPPRYGLG